MFIKQLVLAIALFQGKVCNSKLLKDGVISFEEFMGAFDDFNSNFRGDGRKLQRRPEGGGFKDDSAESAPKTPDEMKAVISGIIKGKDGGKGGYESCEALFKAFDYDNSGTLSFEELSALFHDAGFSASLSALLAQSMLDWYDKSDDSHLSYPELEAACKGGE